jgi:hypothetical protein
VQQAFSSTHTTTVPVRNLYTSLGKACTMLMGLVLVCVTVRPPLPSTAWPAFCC